MEKISKEIVLMIIGKIAFIGLIVFLVYKASNGGFNKKSEKYETPKQVAQRILPHPPRHPPAGRTAALAARHGSKEDLRTTYKR